MALLRFNQSKRKANRKQLGLAKLTEKECKLNAHRKIQFVLKASLILRE